MEAIGALSPSKPLQWNVLGRREASATSQHLPNNLEKPFQRARSTGGSCPVRAASATAEGWILHPFYAGITQTFLPNSALRLLFCGFWCNTKAVQQHLPHLASNCGFSPAGLMLGTRVFLLT